MIQTTKWLLPRAALMIILITSFPIVHAETLALTYDENGNLVSGDGKYRVYDGYNQLRYVYNGSNTSVLLQEYEYHPTEERVLSKKTYLNNGSLDETTIYFSKQHVRIINFSGSFDFTYIYLEGQLVAQVNPDGSKIFIHADHLGSSTIITNQSGDIIENTSYTPHGEVLSGGSEIRYGYEAKEHDTIVGDTDFNARKYKSEWGLFTQPDTSIPSTYDPQLLNRYMFERGNPYKYGDPSGREPVRSQAGTASQVIAHIQMVEAHHPELNANQVLEVVYGTYRRYENTYISRQGSGAYSPNFIYTEEHGVIDQRHFFANAYYGQSEAGRALTRAGQYVIEAGQCLVARHSCFSYEDLSSNELGRQFATGLSNDKPLSEQYASFIGGTGPVNFPNWLWQTMPQVESGAIAAYKKQRSSGGSGLPSGYASGLGYITDAGRLYPTRNPNFRPNPDSERVCVSGC